MLKIRCHYTLNVYRRCMKNCIISIVLQSCLLTVFQSLKPSAHLFTQLSKVLKLTKVQEVTYVYFCSTVDLPLLCFSQKTSVFLFFFCYISLWSTGLNILSFTNKFMKKTIQSPEFTSCSSVDWVKHYHKTQKTLCSYHNPILINFKLTRVCKYEHYRVYNVDIYCFI